MDAQRQHIDGGVSQLADPEIRRHQEIVALLEQIIALLNVEGGEKK